MDNFLRQGETRTGLLGDGDHPAAVAASLTLEDRGPSIAIPHIGSSAAAELIGQWLDREGGSTDLLFEDDLGAVTLLDLRWAGQSGAGIAVTRGLAFSAICHAPRVPEALSDSEEAPAGGEHREVSHLASSIDGLLRFIGAPQFEVDNGNPEKIIFTRGNVTPITWSVSHDDLEADLSCELRCDTRWHSSYGRASMEQRAELIVGYVANEGEADVLFLYQQPLRALLVIVYGADANWRTHQIKGSSYVQWDQSGRGADSLFDPQQIWVPTYLRATAQWSSEPVQDLGFPAFGAADLGGDGLEKWFERWITDDDFRTPMQPAVEAIAGMTRFLEPRLVSLVSALEGLGGWISGTPRRQLTTEEAVQACLDKVNADWSNVADTDLIAGYLATVYNDLKHPQRGRRPSGRDLRFATHLARAIVRLVAIWDLPLAPQARIYFEKGLVEPLEQERGYWVLKEFTFSNPDPLKSKSREKKGVELVRSTEAILKAIIQSALH